MLDGSGYLIWFRFKMVLGTYCHIASWVTCHLVVPLLTTLRQNSGVRGLSQCDSSTNLHLMVSTPADDHCLDPLFYCKMVVFLIVSLILHMLAGILTWWRTFFHQPLGFCNMQVVRERQNNAWFFHQSTFRVTLWCSSWYPHFQHWPMSFGGFFLFGFFF